MTAGSARQFAAVMFEVLFYSLGHEATPATYRNVAEPTLDELQAKLPPDELASARQATAGLELDELVSTVLGGRRPVPLL